MMRHCHPDLLVKIAIADAYTTAVETLTPPYEDGLLEKALAFEAYVPSWSGHGSTVTTGPPPQRSLKTWP